MSGVAAMEEGQPHSGSKPMHRRHEGKLLRERSVSVSVSAVNFLEQAERYGHKYGHHIN